MQSTSRKWLRSPSERVGTLSHADLPPPDSSSNDEEQLLIRALRDRNEDAFATILDRWYSPMVRVARSYVRSQAEAEEVVQDTWLAMLAGLDRFKSRSSLKTWVFRILVNRARTRAKREARTVTFSDVRGLPDSAAGDAARADWLVDPERTVPLDWHASSTSRDDPQAVLLMAELRSRVDGAIVRLPARQQAVITLRDVAGWSADEVCRALELTDANQRVLLHRARVTVRDAVFAGDY